MIYSTMLDKAIRYIANGQYVSMYNNLESFRRKESIRSDKGISFVSDDIYDRLADWIPSTWTTKTIYPNYVQNTVYSPFDVSAVTLQANDAGTILQSQYDCDVKPEEFLLFADNLSDTEVRLLKWCKSISYAVEPYIKDNLTKLQVDIHIVDTYNRPYYITCPYQISDDAIRCLVDVIKGTYKPDGTDSLSTRYETIKCPVFVDADEIDAVLDEYQSEVKAHLTNELKRGNIII